VKTTSLILLWLAFIQGCSKGTGTDNDTIPPVITFNSPLNGHIFTPGQPISISGVVTDDKYIAEVHIHVTNVNTATLLMDVHLYPAGDNGNFNQSITAAAGINYKIQVIAKDRGVNETRSTVEVSCN
jgi:hypothetical protein